MNVWVSLSNTPLAHPPRSNPFLRSSSEAPPFPCITPSTVTCVMVISFMGSSLSLVVVFLVMTASGRGSHRSTLFRVRAAAAEGLQRRPRLPALEDVDTAGVDRVSANRGVEAANCRRADDSVPQFKLRFRRGGYWSRQS